MTVKRIIPKNTLANFHISSSNFQQLLMKTYTKRFTLALLFIFIQLWQQPVYAQTDMNTIIEENETFRKELNEEYADSTESPLKTEDRLKFTGLPFFDIDTVFHVIADFKRAKRSKPFKMKTTTDRKPVYEVYGTATFTLQGKKCKLNIYQSHQLRNTGPYKDYLFLPYTDLTSGNESYGGGRFIDLTIPEGEQIIIDFNQSYNPYCAYNHRYSCPIPPKENFLNLRIQAGVKTVEY